MSMNPTAKLSTFRLLWILALLTAALLLTVTPVAAHEGVHVVQPGETLSQIAQRYGTDVATLRRLNNLSDVDFVWSGQRLVVPLADGSQAASAGPSASPQEATSVYVVQPGDTLSGVAVAFQTSLARLVELNGIYPGQRLLVGQELRVPSQGTSSPAPAAEASQASAAVELPVNHVVQPGEHLGTIAARYGTTPRAIIRANNLANPSLITPGQTLIVPPPSLAERAGQASNQTAQGYHVHTEFPTTTEKWIDVDLSEQRVVAYEGTRPVRSFIVSTGLPGTPTVTGEFRIWAKTPLQDMYGGNRAAGDYYYLEDVPWVQYFYEDYAFHGTYWHNNFGQPMSRGCVNMTIEDAKWLYDWAFPEWDGSGGWFRPTEENATLVIVHE